MDAYKLIEKYRQDDVREVKKSKYLQTIDSLIQVYQDIPEAGELEIGRASCRERV